MGHLPIPVKRGWNIHENSHGPTMQLSLGKSSKVSAWVSSFPFEKCSAEVHCSLSGTETKNIWFQQCTILFRNAPKNGFSMTSYLVQQRTCAILGLRMAALGRLVVRINTLDMIRSTRCFCQDCHSRGPSWAFQGPTGSITGMPLGPCWAGLFKFISSWFAYDACEARPNICWPLRLIWSDLHESCNMGLSENSVPLHPMVNDHYPVPIK